jgi:uncharacterized protein YrrD
VIAPGASVLVRAGELPGRPVVTLAGDRPAEVKDVIFDIDAGRVEAFTLNNPGLFSRSRHDALPWQAVHALGPDAVMIADESAFVAADALAPKRARKSGNVLADQVLTDTGTELGTVVDVVLEVSHGEAEVVGYEIAATTGRSVLIPVPAALSVSGEKLIVPASATEFVSDDLAGFGAAVADFRAKLEGSRS